MFSLLGKFQLTPTCFAMLSILLGIEDQGRHIDKEEANLKGSGPSNKLVLFVIALVLCHFGAIVSNNYWANSVVFTLVSPPDKH